KTVYDAALDENRFPGPKVDIVAVNPPGRGAGESINRLVPPIVIMRHRHSGIRLHRHLEHVDTPGGLVLALEKFQPERAHLDDFNHGTSFSRIWTPPSGGLCRKTSRIVVPSATPIGSP